MANNPVAHFEIPGDNPEELAQFYSRLFDWKIEKMPGDFDYWFISTVPVDDQGMPTEPGGINGGLYTRQAPEQKPINYVSVSSVDEYVARAAELGATVAMGKMPVPGMGWFAQLIDPDGNMFAVWEQDASAG
jgi:predicted enzyme related to lactoylglutathione lyase